MEKYKYMEKIKVQLETDDYCRLIYGFEIHVWRQNLQRNFMSYGSMKYYILICGVIRYNKQIDFYLILVINYILVH